MHVCQYIESSLSINAPGGFAPILPGSSAIEATLAGIAVGSWAKVAGVSGLSHLSGTAGDGGASGVRTAYMSKWAHDPVAGRFYAITMDHQLGTPIDSTEPYLQYDFASNAFSRITPQTTWAIAAGGAFHGSDHNFWAPSALGGFAHYWRRVTFSPNIAGKVFRYDGNDTWTGIELGVYGNSIGAQYFPDRGEVMFYADGNDSAGTASGKAGYLYGWKPLVGGPNGTLTVYANSGSPYQLPDPGDPHQVVVYNKAHACVWLAGGNPGPSPSGQTNFIFNAAGVITQMDNLPAIISAGVGHGSGLYAACYNPGNGKIRVTKDKDTYCELDVTTGHWVTSTVANQNAGYITNTASLISPLSAPSATYGSQQMAVEFASGLKGIAMIKSWTYNAGGELWVCRTA